jgi:exopolysaccharide biosynthesis polyprenyl glycosylphosphotransferase
LLRTSNLSQSGVLYLSEVCTIYLQKGIGMIYTPETLPSRDVRSSVFGRRHKGTPIKGMRVLTLLGLDTFSLCLAWFISELLSTPWQTFWSLQKNPISLVPVLSIELVILTVGGFYKAGHPRRDYLGLIKALTLAEVLLLLIAYFYSPNELISRSNFVLFWVLSISLILVERFLVDRAILLLRHNGAIRYPVFLIADQEHVDQVIRLIDQESRYGIVGIAQPQALDFGERDKTFRKIHQLGTAEAFISWNAIKDRLYLCWQFQSAGILLNVIPIGLEPLFAGSKFWTLGEFPAVSFSPPSLTGRDFLIKRIVDFCIASAALIVMSPLYLIIALLIRLDSPGPVFYRQTRIGLHGVPFKAWKFRTMVSNADQLQKALEAQNETQDGVLFKMKNDPRITRVGRFLRCYSLDELPQLFNVLLGEMSLVGPRPLPVRDVEKFSKHHFVRHEVLPGITGLWQVSGRSDVTDFDQVVQLDLDYIQNWSLGLDLKILLRTIKVVLCKTGAY